MRRLYFDLIGLPPTPSEIDEFVQDGSDDSYERLVDRLLGSKHYGERWARHWLDVVHYADTHGYDKDKLRPNAWPYRDYVIRSFNEDKPYARFVQEQIAGDVLWPHTMDGITATGFIAAGPWDFIGHAEVPETKIDGRIARHLDRDDMVASTMNTFTSTTVQCARCHNHKFDTITQEHYYSLQAVFAALDRADRSYDLDPTVSRQREDLEERRSGLLTLQKNMEEEIRERGGEKLASIDQKLRDIEERRKDEATSDDHAEELESTKAERLSIVESVTSDDFRARLDNARQELQSIEEAINKLPSPGKVYAGTIHTGSGAFKGTGATGGKPRTIHVLHRGDILQPRQLVQPGRFPVDSGDHWEFQLDENHTEGARRAALAHWLVDDNNPLTWRSIVNRIWQYHFGRGIVDSPNDFGRMGAQPSHPELLDWLAVEFRNSGQSLKQLHKLIVMSSVYRQVSSHNEQNSSVDSGNVYLWRMNRRRLSAEEVRDATLHVSGKLNPTMYGPGAKLFVLERPEHSPHYEYHKHNPDDPSSHRRTIYRFIVRSQPDPFMTTLDCADSSQSVPKRDETVTPQQALALLNNKFMLRMSQHFARRVESAYETPKSQINFAFQLTTGHAPNREQAEQLVRYAEEFGLENTCRLMLNLNEFVFVD